MVKFKRLNNKGFAITAIIYGIMLLFVLILASFLSVLIGRNKRSDALLDSTYQNIKYDIYDIKINDDGSVLENDNSYTAKTGETTKDIYITKVRALYKFTYSNGNICNVILPKNVVVIDNTLRGESDNSKLYYYLVKDGDDNNSSDVSKYSMLECINDWWKDDLINLLYENKDYKKIK